MSVGLFRGYAPWVAQATSEATVVAVSDGEPRVGDLQEGILKRVADLVFPHLLSRARRAVDGKDVLQCYAMRLLRS